MRINVIDDDGSICEINDILDYTYISKDDILATMDELDIPMYLLTDETLKKLSHHIQKYEYFPDTDMLRIIVKDFFKS